LETTWNLPIFHMADGEHPTAAANNPFFEWRATDRHGMRHRFDSGHIGHYKFICEQFSLLFATMLAELKKDCCGRQPKNREEIRPQCSGKAKTNVETRLDEAPF
jgi:hypothetical protein